MPMTAELYQTMAARTMRSYENFDVSPEEISLIVGTIGLCGEAGEVAEVVKKGIFHLDGNFDLAPLRKELGDVCWYLACICTACGIDLGEVMVENITKLQTRYPNGFTVQDSIDRVDVKDGK